MKKLGNKTVEKTGINGRSFQLFRFPVKTLIFSQYYKMLNVAGEMRVKEALTNAVGSSDKLSPITDPNMTNIHRAATVRTDSTTSTDSRLWCQLYRIFICTYFKEFSRSVFPRYHSHTPPPSHSGRIQRQKREVPNNE